MAILTMAIPRWSVYRAAPIPWPAILTMAILTKAILTKAILTTAILTMAILTALERMPSGPHSLASVLVSPITPAW
eukprot:scaffold94210_cov48-Phaeocystis_antarctica.AAC.3